MLSLRSILLVAAAFVSLTLASEALVAPQLQPSLIHDGALGGAAPNSVRMSVGRQNDYHFSAVGDRMKTHEEKLRSLLNELKALGPAGKGRRVDNDKFKARFATFHGLLHNLMADMTSIIESGLSVTDWLYLGGVPCSVADLAAIVYSLLDLVAEVLVLALGVGVPVPVSLISSVGTLLVEIVTTVVGLVPGLDAAPAVLLQDLVGSLELVRAGQISVLGLQPN